MDPLTITTTIITLASFINELIEVGESIRCSIEKVNENRRQIRDLTDEVVQILYDLAKLTRGHEDTFRGPEFLSALENLKAELLYVHSKTRKLLPVQLPGLRGVRSQFKAWRKRDDLEGNIGRLKEHAFSAARIEQNTLRIEQKLIVDNIENQVKAQRLEGMMAQVLLETQFGQNIMDQTVEIISADPTHSSLESQYISTQTMCLITSLEGLLISDKLVLDGPLFGPAQASQFTFKQCTLLHLLHEILGVIIIIKESRYIRIPLGSMKNILINLGISLSNMGMVSESIAWEHFKIRMLRHLDGPAAMTLPDMAHALMWLSIEYHRQHQFQSAIQAGQQSLDLWHCLSDSLPEVDIRICLIMILTTQTQCLLETGPKIAALSIAQDAVALARPMLEQIIKSDSGFSSLVDEFNADWSCGAIFELAKALSSLNRHLESYEASKEIFQTIIRLPIPSHLLLGECIDLFLNQICKVAEGGSFSLPMLMDCVILFRNLAHIDPEQFSSQFLWLLHAYAYFAQQGSSSMENIRTFLEPNSDHPPPELDVTRSMEISLGSNNGIQIEDAVRAFHTCPSRSSDPLIQNIFITCFNEAILVLRDMVKDLTFNLTTNEWILWTVTDVVQFLPTPNQLALLQVSARTIEHVGTILADWGSDWEWVLEHLFDPLSRNLWRTGLLDDALQVCEQVIKYLDSHFQSDDVTVVAGEWRLSHYFILCDMGRFPDAIGMIHQATIASVLKVFFLHPYIAQARILRHAGRNQEALQLLRKGVAAGRQKYWTDSVEVLQLPLNFLLAEYAAAWGYMDNPERALKHAEQAVTTCQKDIGPDKDMEDQKCILIHSLVTLSNCLATLGRNDKALAAAQEAMSVYSENASHMWGNNLYTIRKQELGANAFHALSLRLVISEKPGQALLKAEKATELYRELVTLAPRHLPTLASSLRTLGSILWNVGRRDKAIAACEEAVGIMRKVSSPETYFLPALAEALEQLAVYLAEKGDVVGASAAAAECAQVRREFAVLPPEPEFLFEKVVDMVESDDEAEAWAEADEYQDASEEPSDRSSMATPCPPINIDAAVQAKPCGTFGASDVVVVDGGMDEPARASSVLGLTATGEGKSIFRKPLEVDVKLSMRMRVHVRSTLMDVLWWILLALGISFAIAWRRGV
ncbi:hypothetical protein DFH08DRAFT_134664 [Mycena albidolilacea]|uniref:Uncharacterized protein n=1 Tax=Mycena albidolilacea TaxID=1033008 RepID=A0AAD7ESW3_9AGAR|nr:hypothetical protein DFH08DRAFT_134664 [Mycena albidolilacea]